MTFIATKLFHKAGESSGGGGGGGDQHNLGWYATESALTTAHATASNGDWAIVGATDTVWVWDSDTTAWKDTDTKGQVTSVNGQTGAVTVDALPSQTGHSGEFLTTDGTDASWSDKPLVNKATGTNSLAVLGESTSNSSIAIGYGAKANGSFSQVVVIGYGALATQNRGVAIGLESKGNGYDCVAVGAYAAAANYGVAIGRGGKTTGTGACQICINGSGATNSDANTVKIANANGNFEIMSADGTIPTARLTKVNSTITLAAADWSSNTQTVNVTGMTATGVVLVSPVPADQGAYTSAGILCTAQAAGTLTFTCDTVPSADIDVNVVML